MVQCTCGITLKSMQELRIHSAIQAEAGELSSPKHQLKQKGQLAGNSKPYSLLGEAP